MDELQNCAGSGVSALDGLAVQARLLTQSIALNYLQLGRVLCEAKGLVKHGEWGRWLQANAPVGERAAQQMIQVYKRFGDNPNMIQIDSSKLVKMLALPAGAEEDFAAENDVQGMSAREVESAVREKTQKPRKAIRRPRNRRQPRPTTSRRKCLASSKRTRTRPLGSSARSSGSRGPRRMWSAS